MIKIKTEHKVVKARTPKKMKPGMARFRIQAVPIINQNNNAYLSEISFEEKLEPVPPMYPELQKVLDYIHSRKVPFDGSSGPYPPSSRRQVVNGYVAFKLYHHVPHTDLSAIDITHLLQGPWRACPDRHIWTKYADHYRSRGRDVAFKTWLLSVTSPAPEKGLIIQPQTQSEQGYNFSSSSDFSSSPEHSETLPVSSGEPSTPVDPFLIEFDQGIAEKEASFTSPCNQNYDLDFSQLQSLSIRVPYFNQYASSSNSGLDVDYFDGSTLDTPSYIDTFITPLH